MNETLKLLHGRPAPEDMAWRQEREVRCYDFLDALHIFYDRTDHPDRPGDTMEACREIDSALGAAVGKNLFLTNRQHTCFYLLIMPGDKPFKTKELSSQIQSSRLSFGSPEEMEEMLNCSPGSASLMGLMNDSEGKVRLLVDEDILNSEFFGCHPCVNTSSLKLKTSDAFEVFLNAVHHDMSVVKLRGE